MGLLSFITWLLRRTVKLIVYLTIVITIVVLIPNIPPYTTFTSISHAPTKPREGVLAWNQDLDNVKKLFLNKVKGPEGLQVFNGELYSGLNTGEIVKFSPGGHLTFVTKIGEPCEGDWQPRKCGRPLGFRIDEAGKYLYVSDAYHGIWKVDLKTDKKQLLVSPRSEIKGKRPMLFNSIALATNGDFYWTDSSTDFSLEDGAYTALADPSGRLLHYSAARNQSVVLIDGLWFANGVAIAPDGKSLVVAETLGYRLWRYHIDGPKRGQKEVFVDGLPGTPDNVQPLPDGSGVLVGLYCVFDESLPLLMRSMAPVPALRKFVARVYRLLELQIEWLNAMLPNTLFDKLLHHIGSFESNTIFIPKSAGLLRLDWNGNIVGAWFSSGDAGFISDGVVYQDKLYLGSPTNKYVAVAQAPESLKSAFTKTSTPHVAKTAEKVTMKIPEDKKQAMPKTEQTKPVTEKPKPTEAPKPKPTEAPKPKPTEAPKPKPTEAPKPKPTEAPKPKPTEAPKPKPTEPPKPKPTEAPKPKPTEPPKPKPTEAPKPKPTEEPKPKPTEAPKAKPTEAPKPKPTEAPKPKPTEAPKPKPTEAPKPKPTEAPDTKQKAGPALKPSKQQIPVSEEIPVDTSKPTKDKLKVISKDGPKEIPHPEL